MIIYFETSALVGWLVKEDQHDQIIKAINTAAKVVLSSLAVLEAKRALIRLKNDGLLSEAQVGKLKGLLARASETWVVFEITSDIQLRAAEEFPVEPVRSLDAIHLATILAVLEVYPDLKVLTTDLRILKNLEPLGLESVLE